MPVFRFRHRMSSDTTYGHVGVSPVHYRTWNENVRSSSGYEVVVLQPVMELFVSRSVSRRLRVRVGGHLRFEQWYPNVVLAAAYVLD